MSDARLNELDREEFWDVCRRLRPDLTRDDYELLWGQFQRDKDLRRYS